MDEQQARIPAVASLSLSAKLHHCTTAPGSLPALDAQHLGASGARHSGSRRDRGVLSAGHAPTPNATRAALSERGTGAGSPDLRLSTEGDRAAAGSLIAGLSGCLDLESDLVAYMARRTNLAVDLQKKGQDWTEFFEPCVS
jgi:hypothetical protein